MKSARSFLNCLPHRPNARAKGQFGGFTLIELLVTIAVIAILASLLLPALATAKEGTRRTTCCNNVRQVLIAAQLYAHDFNDFLPKPEANCTAMMSKKVLTNFVHYSGMTDILDCPNLHGNFINRTTGYSTGWREQGPNVAIGYHYLGGQKSTPWLGDARVATSPWTSPQRYSDPPGTLVADLNACYDLMTVVPHARRGAIVLDQKSFETRGDNSLLYPEKAGAVGGNLGSMDGSVRWAKMRATTVRSAAHDWGGQLLGWW